MLERMMAPRCLLPLPSFEGACLSSCGSFSLALLFDTATASPQFPTIAPAAQQPALHPSNSNYCWWWWRCRCMARYRCRELVLGMHMISDLLDTKLKKNEFEKEQIATKSLRKLPQYAKSSLLHHHNSINNINTNNVPPYAQ